MCDRPDVTQKITIIADDLTGALDVAGPFASRGHPTFAVVNAGDGPFGGLSAAAVLSINSASRHLRAVDAARRVRDIVGHLGARRGGICIKKIDSTLRGNVAAESLAAAQAFGRANLVVAPAFPAQGRAVRRGMVHVNGVPLSETGFARDALSPPPCEPLDRVFAAAAPDARVMIVPPAGPFHLARAVDGTRIFVVNNETDMDLTMTVRMLATQLCDCLLVGSAGVSSAVARELPEGRAPDRPRATGQIIVAVGSRAELADRQVAALDAQQGVVTVAAPNGEWPDASFLQLSAGTVVLRATADLGGRVRDAGEVAAALARGVARMLTARPVEALVATGGDTAMAILDQLGQRVLQVMGELMPGIPFGKLDVGDRTVWLVTKAGGFGTPTTLGDIIRGLRGEPAGRIRT
ncbi:MAG: hypothetical protein A3G75_05660 [Verrucomicrobia bacterium RIFCSPLOWO2_12_FULL_64_8]|nr:MAG: hypothetical protein A3G75_05660 [Verrucomicrobia bacterium RIFCSPLOWO2_12_FULL_64_8]